MCHALKLLLLLLHSWQAGAILTAGPCPCNDKRFCNPITDVRDHEFVVFDVGGKDWKFYDWTLITTIVTFGAYDPELMCYAHSKQARIVGAGRVRLKDMINPNNRTAWIAQQLDQAKKNHTDGINLDIEEDVFIHTPEYEALTALVQETAYLFHRQIPGSQVSFDVASSPRVRHYNYSAIAKACDFLFVMSYDMWFSIDVAGPNSPYNLTLAGYKEYINLGIDPEKLVMGVPWYGYDYICRLLIEQLVCTLRSPALYKVEIAKQIRYKTIMKQINDSFTGRRWEESVKSPYFDYKDYADVYHQVWYDDPQSISLKAAFVKKRGLHGIGMWNANCLDYSDDPVAKQQTKDMWQALKTF